MLILDHPSQLKPLNLPHIICTLGVFDGVHLGHQKIINNIVQTARGCGGTSLVITFDRHPYSVLNPTVHLPLITSTAHKLLLIDSLGVDICIVMKFTKELSNTAAQTWIKEVLWTQMHIEAIYIGGDSFFGKDGKGDINLLLQWGSKLGFKVVKMEMLRIENVPISSTIIRNSVIRGDLLSAQKFLGRPYSVFGTPIKGTGKGKELGFPTINLDTQDQCLVPDGVYAAWACPDPDKKKLSRSHVQGRGKYIPAVANIGVRPTFGVKDIKPILEIHLLSPEEISTSSCIEVIFTEKIRDEIKFSSASELADQIRKDIIQVKNLFSSL